MQTGQFSRGVLQSVVVLGARSLGRGGGVRRSTRSEPKQRGCRRAGLAPAILIFRLHLSTTTTGTDTQGLCATILLSRPICHSSMFQLSVLHSSAPPKGNLCSCLTIGCKPLKDSHQYHGAYQVDRANMDILASFNGAVKSAIIPVRPG
jgi:hypothetical protein